MRRARALGYLVGGVLLGLGASGPIARAGSYLTHKVSEATTTPATGPEPSSRGLASPSADIPRVFPPSSATDESLRVTFDPGVRDAFRAALPPAAADLPAPLPTRRGPGVEPGHPRPLQTGQNRTVPEPASIVLLVTGLIGLAARRHLLRHRP